VIATAIAVTRHSNHAPV